jgi:hypothetical protein
LTFIQFVIDSQAKKCPPLQVGGGIVSTIVVVALALEAAAVEEGVAGTNGIEVCVTLGRIDFGTLMQLSSA